MKKMGNLEKWGMFSLLDPEFLKKIKVAIVFGNQGNEAMFVTRDDDVYALGSNSAGCLGFGDLQSSLYPRKVEVLCGRNITGFSYGSGPHIVAFSATTGEVYAWGHNGYCEVGNGSSNQCPMPLLVATSLAGRKVTQIACGSHHTLALTSDGEVYAWGQNNCGQVGSGMNNSNTGSPRKVAASIGSRIAVAVACGQACSMAVLDNGEVYGWGYNGNGQLGLGHNVNQLNPCRISGLQGVVVTKLECGFSHSLALSDLGVLYAWGANNHGQLGSGNKANLCSPTVVTSEMGRVVDIAASHYTHISVALTQNDKVYMWGQCRGQSVTSPTLTPFTSMHDVFATFATPAVMWRPLNLDLEIPTQITDSLRQAFDDSESCDLIIKVEGKEIKVHKAILKIRCEHFRSMFQGHWEENTTSVIEIEQFSYPVYRAFLQYLYTDEVMLRPEHALELLVLANAYCEPQLKRRCEHIIKQGITVDNAAMLYANAIQYNAKELEEFCFRFSMNHMTGVVLSPGFNDLDEDTLKGFIHRAAEEGAFRL